LGNWEWDGNESCAPIALLLKMQFFFDLVQAYHWQEVQEGGPKEGS